METTMTDRLGSYTRRGELADMRFERRYPWAIEDEPSPRAGKQPKDDRMLGQDVLLEDLRRVRVEVEHG